MDEEGGSISNRHGNRPVIALRAVVTDPETLGRRESDDQRPSVIFRPEAAALARA